ncbi:hypothetical protein FJT64_001528 [Amphibalanus amphitrite]|uniref:DEP domain-containing protein n=1 Tax=Amphibalanus amphitrite TaxID=1232801 RepID=A0A6A4X5L8_AMPAM|nr:hypothetical protein FJT64_001528 [Amphibalanus amphitrite]
MMIKGTVVVYSIPACPHCRTAKATLTQRGLQYVDDASQWEQLVTLLEQTELNPSDAGAPRIPKPEEAVTTSAPAAVLPVECEKDELSRLAIDLHDRSNLIMDHRVGLFTKIRDSFSGEAFVNWMIKEKESDEANALDMGQQLMDKHFIQNVSGGADSTKFEGSAKAFYRMTEDDNQGALNSGETAGCPPLPAGELAENLRKLMLTMYAENISPDGKTTGVTTCGWRVSCSEVDIFGLNREEKLAFFINVYNALVVHGNIATGHPTNVWQRWKFFNNTAYVLGGSPFTLQDIENGVLRANKKGVGALSPQFSKVDPRRRLSLERAEPRIHFALNCGAKSCPPIKTFSAQNIESELDLASASYLETDDGIRLEPAKGVVHLSTLLKWYRSDFGEDDKEVLAWVLRHLTGEKAEQLKQMLDSGNFKINYIPYDWTNNAK